MSGLPPLPPPLPSDGLHYRPPLPVAPPPRSHDPMPLSCDPVPLGPAAPLFPPPRPQLQTVGQISQSDYSVSSERVERGAPAINYGNEFSRDRYPQPGYQAPPWSHDWSHGTHPPQAYNPRPDFSSQSNQPIPPWIKSADLPYSNYIGPPNPPCYHGNTNYRSPPPPPRFPSDPSYRGTPRFSGNTNYRGLQQFPPRQSFQHREGSLNERAVVSPLPLPVAKTVSAEELFESPGRECRPSHIVVVLRGLPGSGKSHLAKIIRDKEVECGSPAPRILALDSYFLNEVEKTERDPDSGKRVKVKVQEYEYDPALESSYRSSLFKSYSKTLDEGFFPFVIVDAVHDKLSHFDRYWTTGKMKGFEVYIAELRESAEVCCERNIHHRSRQEIEKLYSNWEPTPPHFTRLDPTSLLTDTAIDEVEMTLSDSEKRSDQNSTEQDTESVGVVKSRWEDPSEDKLDKLDAVGLFRSRKRSHGNETEFNSEAGLSLNEYIKSRETDAGRPSKKRVRWADLEEEKEMERKREIGFVIGSGWSHMTDEEANKMLSGRDNT